MIRKEKGRGGRKVGEEIDVAEIFELMGRIYRNMKRTREILSDIEHKTMGIANTLELLARAGKYPEADKHISEYLVDLTRFCSYIAVDLNKIQIELVDVLMNFEKTKLYNKIPVEYRTEEK